MAWMDIGISVLFLVYMYILRLQEQADIQIQLHQTAAYFVILDLSLSQVIIHNFI